MAVNNNKLEIGSSKVTNILLAFVLFFAFIGTCTNMSVSKRTKDIQAYNIEQSKIDMYEHDSILVAKFSDIVNKESEVLRDGVETDIKSALYNFLIYEDDLDKGKTSLSEIRTLLLNEKNREMDESNTK